jgi:hypothetical protein
VGAGEEVRHGLGEVTQRLLLHHLAALPQPCVLGTRLGKVTALVDIARSAAAAGPPPGLLLDGEVPHIPGVGAMPGQYRLLR